MVNIFSLYNYDIQIYFDEEEMDKYKIALNREKFLYEEKGKMKSGHTYRCRIRNIWMMNNSFNSNKRLTYEITSYINKYNGWFYIIPHDVDVKRRRIYIDIIDLDMINMREIFINNNELFKKN